MFSHDDMKRFWREYTIFLVQNTLVITVVADDFLSASRGHFEVSLHVAAKLLWDTGILGWHGSGVQRGYPEAGPTPANWCHSLPSLLPSIATSLHFTHLVSLQQATGGWSPLCQLLIATGSPQEAHLWCSSSHVCLQHASCCRKETTFIKMFVGIFL